MANFDMIDYFKSTFGFYIDMDPTRPRPGGKIARRKE
jgi:hypothetical protein